MNTQDLLKKIKKFFSDLNQKGIPLPLFRDPQSNMSSISFSLVVFSSALCVFTILGKATLILLKLFHMASLDDNTANLLNSMNADQALNFFIACGALYFGRKIQTKGGTTIEADPAKKPTETETPSSQG